MAIISPAVGENLTIHQFMAKVVGDSFQISITPSIPFNSIQRILIESLLRVMLSVQYNGNTLKISRLAFSSFLALFLTV